MMTAVKKITVALLGSLSCNALRLAKPVPVHAAAGFVSASAEHAAELAELSAAATSALDLVEGKAPDWITLIPAGTFTLIDGRGPFRNFDPEGVVSASLRYAGKTEIPADYDHHMDAPATAGIKGVAAGWIKELKAEEGAVRARVEWTAAARQHIEAMEYRYVSPRFAPDAKGNVLFLTRFALTNHPAITDLPAIAAHALNTPKENDVSLFQRLLGALAISASATEDQAIELVRSMVTRLNDVTRAAGLTSAAAADDVVSALRARPEATLFVSAADHKVVVDKLAAVETQVANANTARLTAEISAAVEAGIGKGQIVPAAKQFWIDQCTSAASTAPVTEFLKTAP
ncbi:MAG: hypothetical protein NTV97_34005, partial [Alphaproteobacteria bacterium]|nr:hypothetical protein [Alphaproteobacteria bacterium]